MYVKILDHAHNRSAVIYTTDPYQPLHFGRERFEADPSQWGPDQIMEELKVSADSFDLTQVGSDFTGTYDSGTHGGPFWEVGWVRFHRPGLDTVHLVAATTPIYLLDDSGKTIDRV